MKARTCLVAAMVGICALMVGCGATKDIGAASDAVTAFHARLDTEDYATIYAQADPAFRNSSSERDFLDLMTAVHRKLGAVVAANRQGFFVNFTTSGTRIRLNYSTKFTAGDATEEFLWSKSGNDVALVGYHINSMALVTK